MHFFKKDFKVPDVMQPDLLIACDLDNAVNVKGCYTGTPTLVVEILSQGTRSKDMIDKLNTYMLSGIKEYWVVDPDGKTVLVYGFKDFQMDSFITCKNNDVIRSYWFDSLEASIREIFE